MAYYVVCSVILLQLAVCGIVMSRKAMRSSKELAWLQELSKAEKLFASEDSYRQFLKILHHSQGHQMKNWTMNVSVSNNVQEMQIISGRDGTIWKTISCSGPTTRQGWPE